MNPSQKPTQAFSLSAKERTERSKKGSFLYSLGFSLYGSELHEKAAQIFQLAAFYQPDEAVNWIALGVCHLHLKQYTASLAALTMASYQDPENPQIPFYLSHLFFTLNEVERAEFFVQVGLEKVKKRPHDPDAQRLLPYMMVLDNDFKIALEREPTLN